MGRRFVRRRGGSSPSYTVHYLAVVAVALALASIMAVLASTISTETLLNVAGKIDPRLLKDLVSGSAWVYVSYDTSKGPAPHLKCYKRWVFGTLVICKTRLSMSGVERLAEMSSVISIYEAQGVKARVAPLYFLNPRNYPFKEVDIDNRFHEAWGPWCGRNVTVAIIDTGIDYTHPDFFDENGRSIIKVLVSALYVWPNGSLVTWNLEENPNITALLDFDMKLWREYGEPAFLDINGHGTHVAGIIAGRGWASHGKYKGIAWCAKLVVIKAFNRDGTASIDTCLTALEWVYNNSERYHIKILSLSWGAAMASNGNDPLSLACDRIFLDKHVWIFAAAGNEGNYPYTVVVPAVAKYVIAVGAWDAYHDKLAPFSSLGPTKDNRMKPDFVAAGVMVVSCASRYANFPPEYMVGRYYVALSGTSMATPVVAGIAADFIEYYRYWHHHDPTLQDFIHWELINGKRINPVFKDFVTGYGIPIAPHAVER